MAESKTKIKRFVAWFFLTMLRTMTVITGYLLYSILIMLEHSLAALGYIGRKLGVSIKIFRKDDEQDYTKKFTDDQIIEMSELIKGETINEIAEKFDISYRQARKIKQIKLNTLNINQYRARHESPIGHLSWEDQVV